MAASHVFVSHSSSDADVVRKLHEALAPHGADLWVDRRELAPGDALDQEIRAAVDEAAHVIVVLSLEALSSAWVKKEVEYAQEVCSRRGDSFSIVPVLRPPFEPSMTAWFLGEDIVAIPLGEDPGAFDQAVADILVALGLELPEHIPEVELPEASPLADLILDLSEPGIHEDDGTRRASARARLVFRPARSSTKPSRRRRREASSQRGNSPAGRASDSPSWSTMPPSTATRPQPRKERRFSFLCHGSSYTTAATTSSRERVESAYGVSCLTANLCYRW